MNALHQKAIELKYEGKSHAEISLSLGKELSEGTLKQYFSENGMLYVPYLDYEYAANKKRLEESTNIFKKSSVKASQALTEGLERAINHSNDKLIIKYSCIILDRAGLDIDSNWKRSGVDNTWRTDTYEEFVEKCRARGIDPKTGLRSIPL